MEMMYTYAFFIIYAFLGWVCEDIYCGIGKRKFINRGFLYGPYCPIYGFGALLVLYPLLAIGNHPVFVFIAGMILTSILEYVTSYIMEKLFATRWWDYTTYPFNINGRVCLQNSLLFGLLSLVVVYGVHPIIQDFVVGLNANFLVVFEVVFTICFIADIICTVVTLMKRKQVFKKLRMDIDELVDQFEKDRDEFNDHLEQWLSEKKDVIDLTPIQERMAMIEKIKKKHVMRAFPDRQLSNRLQHLEELGNKVKDQK